jgi:hypothetical protein
VRAAVATRDTKAVELLLAHCAALSRPDGARARRPVVDRLGELIGVELTRLLVFALVRRPQRARRAR